MSKPLTETSKFLSYVLRHEPQSIGLSLDTEAVSYTHLTLPTIYSV